MRDRFALAQFCAAAGRNGRPALSPGPVRATANTPLLTQWCNSIFPDRYLKYQFNMNGLFYNAVIGYAV